MQQARNTDLECKRCGFKGTLPGKQTAPKCPKCGAGDKAPAVQAFDDAFDQAKAQLTMHAMLSGWPYAKLEWKRYPCSEGGRVDLSHEGVRLATIRVTFEPPAVKHRWVGPAHGPEHKPEDAAS